MAPQRVAEGRSAGAVTGAERRCLATGAVLPKSALIRFVVGPEAVLFVDIEGRLPGRGLWVAADRAALEKAVAKRLFGRSARQVLIVPGDLPAQVEARLEQRCLDLLGLARRAGHAVAGFEKVRDWIRSGRAALLLEAADGAADGRAKLRGLAPGLPMATAFDAARLGAVFGRDHAVHVALAAGGPTERLAAELARLAGVRGNSEPGAGQRRATTH
ncbi:MAG: RNA-binding protein [Inquilinus sp.]|nr:RNA-binding protein [Inquilinus sp.]